MLEKEVEQKLVKAVKLAGGFCIKFTSPGKKTRALQKRRMKQLSALGFRCYVVDNTDVIRGVIDEIQSS